MSTARINLKSIDYFKFKKLVIDGNRDDYAQCSKEVKLLCDYVQTLKFRDEEFDDVGDRSRFEEICGLYKQILSSKRIDSIDMRIKSGWWGDHKNAYSAGKIKPAALKELLIQKASSWISRHGEGLLKEKDVAVKIDGPGLYVFKHREHQCFQFVGMAEKLIQMCAEKLRTAFDGSSHEPLAALLLISMASDWDFYFLPVAPSDSEKVLRVLENDLILKHDCIWPHGLNFKLNISSLLEVSEFRKSCLRHHWPPEGDVGDEEINLRLLREQVSKVVASPASSESSVASTQSDKTEERSKPGKTERPKSAKAAPKNNSRPASASAEKPAKAPPSPRKLPPTPKPPASPAKRPQSAKTPRPATATNTAKKSPRTPDSPKSSPVEEKSKLPARKIPKPKASPTESKILAPKVEEQKVEEVQDPEAEPVKEPEPVIEVKEVQQPPVTPEPEVEEEAEPGPLKRQGTYEVLPTDEDDEGKENNYVPDSPEGSDNESGSKAVRPTTLETDELLVNNN
ncbi:hypothetical protein CAPTEDRAFT_215767 [Capitella teleta]|uniref:Uncharacterized protein n=1 Tax=Capitella teleta TaxID=283909 RepID=R7VHP4_CAPTE|nr:hypothetical protein CAPTEDRAFT_215767 [Capitella teleta]|eukprot:ELU15821.1 hypothetical protein CAPTEDRAFT_215767 [Capitella teleta]